MKKTISRLKLLATVFGVSMIATSCLATTAYATEINNLSVSNNEVETIEQVGEAETEISVGSEMSTEATISEIKNSPVLSLNVAREGDKLATVNEEKWYQFTLTERGYFYINMKLNELANPSMVGNGWDLYIYRGTENLDNPIKTVKEIKSDTSSSILSMGIGTYYIKIKSNATNILSSVNVPYDLTVNFVQGDEWEQEDNGSNVVANEIQVNRTYKGGCYYYNDEDWYQFTIPSNGYFEVEFGTNDLTDVNKVGNGWNLMIYDSDLKLIRQYKEIKTSQIQSELASDKLPFKAGKYYIKIETNYKNINAPVNCYYDLKVVFSATDLWETEYNNDNTKADIISIGSEKAGLLLYINDVDWYCVNVNRKGKLYFDLIMDSSVKKESLNNGWKVTVYSPDLKEVAVYKEVKTDLDMAAIPVTSGKYYVKIESESKNVWAPVACIYHLKADFVESTKETEVHDFVSRMYTVVLNREAEAGGLDYWSQELLNQKQDGAALANGFINSPEFKNRGLSDSNYLDVLYETFFGRIADSDGKNYWLSEMRNGMSRNAVLAGFVNSKEFGVICESYGIARGTMENDGSSIYNAGVHDFVLRNYTKALGRDGEVEGVEYWSHLINTKQKSALDCAMDFFHSKEFMNKNLNDADYVEVLYETYFGRASDASGKNYWLSMLASGNSRDWVLSEFAHSPEFKNIMAQYGL